MFQDNFCTQYYQACNDSTTNQKCKGNLVYVLLRGNVLNTALVLLKLSTHFSVFLLQVNYVHSATILFYLISELTCHCEEPSFTLISVISMLPAVVYHQEKNQENGSCLIGSPSLFFSDSKWTFIHPTRHLFYTFCSTFIEFTPELWHFSRRS